MTTSTTSVTGQELQAILTEAMADREVPGATVALLHAGEVATAAAGVLALGDDAPATPNSLFRLGSVTKMYTATLVVALADAGELDLDLPVSTWLGDADLGTPDLASAITPRHLISHTSGLVGDHFVHAGDGDDCLGRYVATLAGIEPVHPPGELFSYGNAGYLVAGRVVEIVTGLPFETALNERLLAPAGLDDTRTLPEEQVCRERLGSPDGVSADVARLAVGHLLVPGEGQRPNAPDRPLQAVWTRSVAPAGSTLAATAADVVRFAALHLEGGRDVLSAGAVASMQRAVAAMPGPGPGSEVGLGWHLDTLDGHRSLAHAGAHDGQGAVLWVLPDDGVVCAFASNGPTGQLLFVDLAARLGERLGLPFPQQRPPSLPATGVSVDLSRYAGEYHPGLHLTRTDDGLDATFDGPLDVLPTLPLTPGDHEWFLINGVPGARFLDFDDDGAPTYLHLMNRAYRRRAASPGAT